MSFFKITFWKTILTFFILLGVSALADNHDKKEKSNITKEEPLPLNDPFVGDSSFSGGVQVITSGENSEKERKRIEKTNKSNANTFEFKNGSTTWLTRNLLIALDTMLNLNLIPN